MRERKLMRTMCMLLIVFIGISTIFFLTSGHADQTAAETDTDSALIKKLRNLPQEEYQRACSFEENRSAPESDSHVVLLAEDRTAGFQLYGYQSGESTQGWIAQYQGTKSYFDLYWDSWHFQPDLYAGDFDRDGMQEFALHYPGGYGTGISISQLGIFEVRPDHTLLFRQAKTMSESWLEAQLGSLIHFNKEEGKIEIGKDGRIYKEIDLTASKDYETDADISVIYTTQISFKIEDGRIRMPVQVLASTNHSYTYMEGLENTETEFEVLYRNGTFTVDIPRTQNTDFP